MVARQRLSQCVTWLMLVALLTGCAALEPRPTPEPSPEPTVEAGEIVFDGTGCTYTGLTEMPMGRYSFVVDDQSDKDVHLYVVTLTDGKTFQDVLEMQSEPGAYFPKPDWAKYAIEPGSATYKPDGRRVRTYLLTREGEHILYVGGFDPWSLWFCAPFWVTATPSG
ncbi:MAG: hypothetical protein PVH41_12700 [Anaerolineae bacterium]